MTIQDEAIARKVNGEEGFREGIFEEAEGPELADYVENIYKSVKKSGVTAGTAEAVLGISRHFERGSFDVKPNGHEADWKKIEAMSAYLVKHRPEAHFVIGAREQGFTEAKRATQKAISSGFVVHLVVHLIETQGSPRLKKWIQGLNLGMQRELDRIIGQSAEYFWGQFERQGWGFIDSWVDTQANSDRHLNEGLATGQHQIIGTGTEARAGTTNGHAGYNGSNMGERFPGLPQEAIIEATNQQLGLDSWIDSDVAAAALSAVLEEQLGGYDGNPRRRPFRTLEVMAAFARHDYGAVTLEDLEAEFDYDPNSKVSLRKTITNVISGINRSFEDLGLDVKIESARITVYRFCRRTT